MRDHWYCGNIPPRPLDDKRKDFEFGGKKKKTRQVWTNQNRFWKKVAVFFKKRERRQKCQGEVSQSKERGEKDRCKVDERGEG
jgi:hypothetical protein